MGSEMRGRVLTDQDRAGQIPDPKHVFQAKMATPCMASAMGSPDAFQIVMRWLL